MLPELNLEELLKALATGKEVTRRLKESCGEGKRETYSAPAVKSVENEKMSYSRVEKRKSQNFTKIQERKFKCCNVGNRRNFRNVWTCNWHERKN